MLLKFVHWRENHKRMCAVLHDTTCVVYLYMTMYENNRSKSKKRFRKTISTQVHIICTEYCLHYNRLLYVCAVYSFICNTSHSMQQCIHPDLHQFLFSNLIKFLACLIFLLFFNSIFLWHTRVFITFFCFCVYSRHFFRFNWDTYR